MKKVLITGGSSGLGYGLSEKFAEAGYTLLWVAKPEEELERAKEKIVKKFPSLIVMTLAKDLTQEDACSEVYEWAKEYGPIDVLVNNAGFGTYGLLNTIPIERELAMIDLNVKALYMLSRYFLKDMVERDEGTFINISSNSSFETVPRLLTYSSTKAFVKHFSRGLNEELKMMGSKVKTITICPAAISDTPFKTSGDMAQVNTFSKGLATTNTQEVVKDIWCAFTNNKSYRVSGWKMRWLAKLNGILPFGLVMYLTKRETDVEG